MKKIIINTALSAMLLGCVHKAPNYPGASGSVIVPANYVDAPCPDFSGRYEGNGHLIHGDETARIFGQRMFFDMVFPITAKDEWQTLNKNYRKHDEAGRLKGVFFPPDFATVTQLSDRSVFVTLSYTDAPIGSYHSEFSNKAIFVCADGKLIWGGADSIKGQSEWGSNSGNRSFSISFDDNGDLIYTRNQQVHMHIMLGIPAGTAEYSSTYRFKRLTGQ
jgi:hypothetical protein